MESFWLAALQVGGFLVLLVALGDLGLSVAQGLRRYFHQQEVYAWSLESFDEKLMTARIRRIDRERESTSWAGHRKFRVAHKIDEGGNVASFHLEPHDGKPIPPYRPGQYLTFSLRIPETERPVVRCYSLSDAADPSGYRITIKRIPPPPDEPDAPPGAASSYFHEQIEVDSIIDVKAPAGDFTLDLTKNRPVVLAAGGIGLTPLLAMLNTLAGRDFDREVYFFYGVRNPDEHIMREHLESLATRYPQDFHPHICYSEVPEAELPGGPNTRYHAEMVSVDLFKRELPSSNFEYYICGPPPMMDSITHGLREWGVPDDHVHFESFGSASVKTTARAEDVVAGTGDVVIEFARTGREVRWDPSAGSLLDLADQLGVFIESGCRAGSCGTCVTAIKSGEVAYLQDPGEQPDAGSCLTCISVPKTNLVLDA